MAHKRGNACLHRYYRPSSRSGLVSPDLYWLGHGEPVCSRISHRGGQASGGWCLKNVRFGVRLQSNCSSTSAPALRLWGYLVREISRDRCRPFRGEPCLHPSAGVDGRGSVRWDVHRVNVPASAGGALRDSPWLAKSRPVTGDGTSLLSRDSSSGSGSVSVAVQSGTPLAHPHWVRGLPYLCLELLMNYLGFKKNARRRLGPSIHTCGGNGLR